MRDHPVERLSLDPRSPWWGEHRSRYVLARDRVRGCRVLDVACGSGFGSAMLAECGASAIVGCDVSLEGVLSAASAVSLPAVFVVGDGTALPLASASFDIVVSFETLEHVTDAKGFLNELARVLRPGGILLLSTPNAEITARYPRNPFHVREYTAPELRQLLGDVFGSVELVGQVLPKRYGMTPFLPGYDRPRGVGDAVRLALWKVLRRLPRVLGDALARTLLRRSLYPAEGDFLFVPETASAHVLVATCRV